MENTLFPTQNNRGKATLVTLMALSFIVVILFWIVIQSFKLSGLPLYFTQLGLYLVLYLFAWWGMRHERLYPQVNGRLILKALAWSLIGWLVFLLFIQVLGMARLPEEFQALRDTPAWKIGAQILSTWFFVGLGEEVLFRGYFLKAFLRHFTQGTDRRRTVVAVLVTSAFFSLWHLPNRVLWLVTGEVDLVTFLISFLVLFLLGIGYSYLFIRSDNILLAGLVHGLSDYPLVGMSTQMAPIILLTAIGCVEITRWVARARVKTLKKKETA